MRQAFKVSIIKAQMDELAKLTNQNNHTESMRKLCSWVLIELHHHPKKEMMDHIIEEAEVRLELMSTIEKLHLKYKHLPDTCYRLRYDLMNKTLACIKNEDEVRECL